MIRRGGRYGILATFLACWNLNAAFAQDSMQVGDVVVSLQEADLPSAPASYSEVQVLLHNTHTSHPRTVKLQLVGLTDYVSLGGLTNLTKMIQIEPSSYVVTRLWVPPTGQVPFRLQVWVQGQRQVSMELDRRYYHLSPDSNFSIMASVEAEGEWIYHLREALVNSGASKRDVSLVVAGRPVEEWLENWLAYSGWDVILMDAAEWERASEGCREALEHAVRMGAFLVIADGDELPFGRSVTWDSALERDACEMALVFECGLGRGLAACRDLLEHPSFREYVLRVASKNTNIFRWQHTDWDAMTRDLLGKLDVETPLRILLLVVLGFSVLVGPLNYLFLSRRDKKILLLVTVPGIALLGTLSVIGFAWLYEGFRQEVRANSLTFLDQTRQKAATFSFLGLYSTLTPSDGLRFKPTTEIRLAFRDSGRHHPVRRVPRLAMDTTVDQHLTRGWLQARIPRVLVTRQAEDRQERLLVDTDDQGAVTVVNGLGVTVKTLWLRDKNGAAYTTRDLAPGQRRVLTTLLSAASHAAYPGHALQDAFLFHPDQVSSPWPFLPPRSYLADVSDSPFLDPGLQNPDDRTVDATILGVF